MSEFNRLSLGATFAAGVGLALAFGTVIIATFGLFLIAMSREFGWGLGQTAGLLSVAALGQAPLSPLVGRLIDRVGVRPVVLPGIVLYGLSIMALSTANGSTLQIYLLFLLVGITSSLVTMLPYSKIVAAWFSIRRGTMLSGYNVLAVILGSAVPQIARRLIDSEGWRAAYLSLGAGVILIGLPVLALLLHEPAKGAARYQPAPAPLAIGMTAAAARRNGVYWRIILAITLCSIAVQAVYTNMAPLLVERGLSRATATNALSLYMLSSVAAQLAMGFALDKTRSPAGVAPALGLAVIGLAVLYSTGSSLGAVVGGTILGASVGAEISLAKFLHARYFGNRAFGEVFGLQFLFIGLSAAIGPASMGALHDLTGNYQVGIISCGVLIALSVVIIGTLPRYDLVRPPRARDAGSLDPAPSTVTTELPA